MQDGACTEFTPTHAGALHALLDQMFGAAFNGTACYRKTPFAIHRVLHPRRVGGEIAAFALQHLERLRIRRGGVLQQRSQPNVAATSSQIHFAPSPSTTTGRRIASWPPPSAACPRQPTTSSAPRQAASVPNRRA